LTKSTHTVVGVALTLPLLHVYPFYALVGLIGANIADKDRSIFLKHRGISHSFMALILTTSIIYYFSYPIAIIYGYNYFIHLILDCCTVTGCPLFLPISKKYYGFKFMKTGDPLDLFVRLTAVFFIATKFLGK